MPETNGSALPEITTIEKRPAAVPRRETDCWTALSVLPMLSRSSRGADVSWSCAMRTPLAASMRAA